MEEVGELAEPQVTKEEEVEQSNDQTLALNSETYNMYKKFKEEAGFTDDNECVQHLVTSAEDISIQKQRVASLGLKSVEVTAANVSTTVIETAEADTAYRNRVIQHASSHRADTRMNRVSFIDEVGGVQGSRPLLAEVLEDALGTVSSVLLTCEDCGKVVETQEELNTHKLTCVHILTKYLDENVSIPETRKFIYCRLCGMRCTDKQDYKKHFNQHHSNQGDLHTCKHCNRKKAFTEKKKLLAHHKTEPVCPSCGKRFNKLKTLSIHMKDKKHDKEKRAESSPKKAHRKAPHVPHVTEVMEKSIQPDLPEGFNFMSVRLSPLFRLPNPETERVIHVPETAYRQGYSLRADFSATPFPEPPPEDYEEYSDNEP